MLIAGDTAIERLRQIIEALQRHRFGRRRAEALREGQLLRGLDGAELVGAARFAPCGETASAAARARQSRANRGALPTHLPRIEMMIGIESDSCPRCSGKLHRIGEDVAGPPHRAGGGPRDRGAPAENGPAGPARTSWCRRRRGRSRAASRPRRRWRGRWSRNMPIILPLWRQTQIYGRQGVALDRSALAAGRVRPSGRGPCMNGCRRC